MSEDQLVEDGFEDDVFQAIDEDPEVEVEAEDDLDEELEADDLGSFDDGDEEELPTDGAATLDAAEDGDDEDAGEPAIDLAVIDGLDEVLIDDDDDEDDDGLRPDEFVCRSCHMARRGSALADPDAMLCRDCV